MDAKKEVVRTVSNPILYVLAYDVVGLMKDDDGYANLKLHGTILQREIA